MIHIPIAYSNKGLSQNSNIGIYPPEINGLTSYRNTSEITACQFG